MKLKIPTKEVYEYIARIQFVQSAGITHNQKVRVKRDKAKTVKVDATSEQEAIDKLSRRFPPTGKAHGRIWHLLSIRKYEDKANAT